MPRRARRQRIVVCDCKDCVDIFTQADAYEWEPAAKQLPPPRSLIILLEGFNDGAPCELVGAASSVDAQELPHLNSVARRGVSFCLAQKAGDQRSLLAQVLGLGEAGSGSEDLRIRFKGLQCAVASTSPYAPDEAKAAGAWPCSLLSAGLCRLRPASQSTLLKDHGIPGMAIDARDAELRLPGPEAAATRIQRLLQLHEGRASNWLEEHPDDASIPDIDMLVLHLRATDVSATGIEGQREARVAGLQWADHVLRTLNHLPLFHSRVLLHVAVSFAAGEKSRQKLVPGGQQLFPSDESGFYSKLKRPLQSWQFDGIDRVDIDLETPVLVSSVLTGVTRCDACKRFSLSSALWQGGQGGILVGRLMDEIAYKIARAPKYGA